MLLNIIFSFNRAMQLDYLLKSTLKNFKLDYKIIVIYHTSGKHSDGYKKLICDYSNYPHISFIERKPNKLSLKQKLTWKKDDKNKFLQLDNFKELLETTLDNTDCELVMFNTDDGYWLDEVTLDFSIKNLIKYNPKTISYRFYVGENLDEFPSYVKKWGNHYLWDYFFDDKVTHWSYPFAVDGTIYNTKGILEILKKVHYYNPVTLEGNVERFAKKNNLLSIGLSPILSKLIGTKLNRVAVETQNPTIHIKPEILNDYFLDGYTLELQLPENITNTNIVPLNIYVNKNNEKTNIYKLDNFGQEVQSNLGIEGAKKQME